MPDPSLNRPTPPPSRGFLNELFPVNPLEVAGGLYGLGTQAAGNAASYAASHSPLDFLSPGGAPSTPGTQSSANQFGGDVTAMLDSPAHGHVTPSMAAVPIVAAGAKLLPEAKGAAAVAETIASRAEPPPPIVAYHGSPYSFDRFDLSKIGTGEGAQAYGRGLYFAQNEGVAKGYRDALTGGKWTYAGPSSENWDASALDYLDRKVVNEQGMPAAFNEAIGRLQNSSKFYNDTYGGSGSNLYDNAVARLQRMDPSQVKPAGHMYQVGINADPDSFLDWDKPLSQQPPKVQQGLADVLRYQKVPLTNNVGEETTGGQMMGYLQQRFNNDVDATNELSSSGVQGIKYLDQGSRAGTGGGTSNYVVFNDNMVNILKKYGLAGLGTAGGAAALTAGGQSSLSPVSPAEAAPSSASAVNSFYPSGQ